MPRSHRRAAPARRVGARRPARRAGRHRLSRFQLSAWRAASSGSASRSSTTSARRSGPGGPGGSKTMREIADRVLVIFPFEEAIYRDGGVPVEFVGHPLVDLARAVAAARAVPARAWGSSATRRPSPSCRAAGRTRCARILPDLAACAPTRSASACRARSSSSRARRTSTTRLFDALHGRRRRRRSSKARPTRCWRRPTSR